MQQLNCVHDNLEREKKGERERQKQTEIKRDKEVRKSTVDIETSKNYPRVFKLFTGINVCVCVCTSFDEKGTNIPILPLNVVYTNTSEPPGINDTL